MIDVRRRVASSRPHERLTPRASRVGDHVHVQLRRVWPDQAGRFVAALADGLSDLPAVWIDVRLLDGLLVLALDREVADGPDGRRDAAVAAVVAAVETAEARAGIDDNPFPEHRHGSPVEDEPLLRAAAEVVADVFAFGLSVSLRALRVPRPPVEVDMEGLVALMQNVPGLRRTLARWVGRATAEAGAGVAAALAGGLFQNLVGPVVGFAYHSLRLGELRARQEAWLEAEPRLYGPSAESPVAGTSGAGTSGAGASGAGASSELAGRPLPRPPGPVERIAEMTWVASLGTFVATLPFTGSVENALSVLASGAPKAARLGREAFGSHLSRDLGRRGIVVLRPGSLRLLDQIDVVVVEGRLWNGEGGAAARFEQVAAANQLGIVVVGGPVRRRSGTRRATGAPDGADGSVRRVPAADGPSEVRRLQITGRVVATVGGPSFAPLAAGDLPIGVTVGDGRAPDGSHVICAGGLADAARVLGACRPARQASRESADLSLAGAVAGALLAIAPAIGPRRQPRVLTAIDTAALVAVANAVRHARHAESAGPHPEPAQGFEPSGPVPVPALRARADGEAALA